MLIGDRLTIKIADYGLSRQTDDDKNYYRFQHDNPLPIRWTAPEVLTERTWTAKTDIYSFGIVVYEVCASGAFPFDMLDDRALLVALTDPTVPLDRYLPLLHSPARIAAISLLLRGCVTRDPSSRPAAAAIANGLRVAMLELGRVPGIGDTPGRAEYLEVGGVVGLASDDDAAASGAESLGAGPTPAPATSTRRPSLALDRVRSGGSNENEV